MLEEKGEGWAVADQRRLPLRRQCRSLWVIPHWTFLHVLSDGASPDKIRTTHICSRTYITERLSWSTLFPPQSIHQTSSRITRLVTIASLLSPLSDTRKHRERLLVDTDVRHNVSEPGSVRYNVSVLNGVRQCVRPSWCDTRYVTVVTPVCWEYTSEFRVCRSRGIVAGCRTDTRS